MYVYLCSMQLILVPVGFYAGLNLIAWGMIFCFVRETKQLTLEEIDRASPFMSHVSSELSTNRNHNRRGFPSTDQQIPLV